MANRRDLIRAMAFVPAAYLGGCGLTGARMAKTPPLQVRGSLETLEISPVLLAARDFYPGGTIVRDGGIGDLVGAPRVADLGDASQADIATHAETQALRYSVANPEVRIVMTVTEARYRIVARRSAGIASVADLKGKRVATLANTSAGFFLARMLDRVGLSFTDVDALRISPIRDMAGALAAGRVDAVAIWEPHAANALASLGSDGISFPGDGVYRELFNLNSTAAKLADPKLRPRIVQFVRSVILASQAIARDAAPTQRLVAATGNFTLAEVERSWPTLHFSAGLPADLLDVLEAEERWLAAQDHRPARPRGILSSLIDTSVLSEARGA